MRTLELRLVESQVWNLSIGPIVCQPPLPKSYTGGDDLEMVVKRSFGIFTMVRDVSILESNDEWSPPCWLVFSGQSYWGHQNEAGG